MKAGWEEPGRSRGEQNRACAQRSTDAPATPGRSVRMGHLSSGCEYNGRNPAAEKFLHPLEGRGVQTLAMSRNRSVTCAGQQKLACAEPFAERAPGRCRGELTNGYRSG